MNDSRGEIPGGVRQVHTYVGRKDILFYAMAVPIWLYKVEYSAFKESTCTCWGGEKKESFLFDPGEGDAGPIDKYCIN